MPRRALLSALLATCALTIVSGVILGRLGGRWGPTPAAQATGDNLHAFPTQFGDWETIHTGELSDDAVQALQPIGHWSRTYRHCISGATVHVTALFGFHGPISVHTPQVCMTGSFTPVSAPDPVTITAGNSDAQRHEFRRMGFRSRDIDGRFVRSYWGWSDGNSWVAPRHARFSLARSRYLYKVQLLCHLSPGNETDERDAGREFLEDFIVKARRHLFSSHAN